MESLFFDFNEYFRPNVLCKLSKNSLDFNNLTIKENRNQCASILGLDNSNIAYPIQTHSNKVIDINIAGKYSDVDGLITTNQNIILSIQVADCVPIFIYDLERKCKGLVHSGWRGTADKIISNTIKIFTDNGSNQSDIMVLIGPSIRKCCYEVGEELLELFDSDCIQSIESKYMLDISCQIKLDLKNIQIPEENIFDSKICTYCDSDCHSYRREKGAGRMIAFFGEVNV